MMMLILFTWFWFLDPVCVSVELAEIQRLQHLVVI